VLGGLTVLAGGAALAADPQKDPPKANAPRDTAKDARARNHVNYAWAG
jgi:hypothetical protein